MTTCIRLYRTLRHWLQKFADIKRKNCQRWGTIFRTLWYKSCKRSHTISLFSVIKMNEHQDTGRNTSILTRKYLFDRHHFHTSNAQGGSLMTGKSIEKSSVRLRHNYDFSK